MPSQAQSQFQNRFRLEKPEPAVHNVITHVAKRNRQTLSCATCRRKKFKCDRRTPCSSCIAKGNAETCSFGAVKKDDRRVQDNRSKPTEAQARLQQLEEMVTSLMRTNQKRYDENSLTTSDNEPIDRPVGGLLSSSSDSVSKGHLEIDGDETKYRGETHWAAILGNIHDIQEFLENDSGHMEEIPTPSISDGPELIISGGQSITLSEACSLLPPRHVVDKLVSIYLRAEFFRLPIIHTGKFMSEYNLFWAAPLSSSILWLSMLFSILWFASQIERNTGQPLIATKNNPANQSFYVAAGRSLVSGKYHKAKQYSVEAVLLLGLCKLWQGEDSDADVWMIMGIGARLALKMGYHRDPRHLPKLSPFEGEMRRRAFYLIETFDLLLSFQAGLPAIIHEEDCDTEAPRNLFDQDFDEDCLSLPPSRSNTDHTPMIYYCHKNRITRIFRRVIRHANCQDSPSQKEIWQLDAEIRKIRDDTPPSLRIRPLNLCLADGVHLVLQRLNVELVYLKCICVLHRRYLIKGLMDKNLEVHKTTCTDAALQILSLQSELHEASEPDGIFFDDRWTLSVLALHDFLMAAMITCLGLHESRKLAHVSENDRQFQEKSYYALKRSYDIWMSRRDFSKDARRASNILAVMLAKVPHQAYTNASLPTIMPPNTPIATMNHSQRISETEVEQRPPANAASTLTDVDSQDMLNDWMNFNYVDPLDTILSNSDNLDWGVVDQYLVGPSNDALP